jgi:large subunit ribosomal protein L24
MIVSSKLKKNDLVKVISGREVGKTGKIIEINRAKGRVLIEGLNLVKKAIRKKKQTDVGGIKDIEASINISNVMIVCQKCKKPTRIGYKIENEKKKRICKKCKGDID